MDKLNKNKIILVIAIILCTSIITIISAINKLNVKTQLFDLTENEPLKQAYIRNEEHFKEDIVPNLGMTEEQYKDFFENPDNYIVYSFRCNIENNSNKEFKAKFYLKNDNMWIDTVTMANADDKINKKSSINKSISILIKMDKKSKKEIQSEVEKIKLDVHLFNINNAEKEVKKLNSKF